MEALDFEDLQRWRERAVARWNAMNGQEG
nr:hypothetical protein [Croceicoccus sp. YJ47]